MIDLTNIALDITTLALILFLVWDNSRTRDVYAGVIEDLESLNDELTTTSVELAKTDETVRTLESRLRLYATRIANLEIALARLPYTQPNDGVTLPGDVSAANIGQH